MQEAFHNSEMMHMMQGAMMSAMHHVMEQEIENPAPEKSMESHFSGFFYRRRRIYRLHFKHIKSFPPIIFFFLSFGLISFSAFFVVQISGENFAKVLDRANHH